MTARAVMVLGCTSGAGKSWLTTALCRIYARKGLRVAPFKAQNMSNHARVVVADNAGFGEIGSAQYFQAMAAGVTPDVRMNPVLLKPEADTRSQVVVMGQVVPTLAAIGWRERSGQLAEAARQAYASLARDFDLIVLEGAGSPAETNLALEDYVNLGAARWSGAQCLLVSDIDRGGSFAHLYGTHALMPEDVRRQLRGFVLNRFRGDPLLLDPAPQDLERATGVPTLAVVPYVYQHGLPEEDAVPTGRSGYSASRVAVIVGPAASNLDEFERLKTAGVNVRFVRSSPDFDADELVVLPGSKQTALDLTWLRESGLAAVIRAHAERGGAVLGICGGMQMLGISLNDPMGLEGGAGGRIEGLGLLPLSTEFSYPKRLVPTRAVFANTSSPWQGLHSLQLTGYEIHVGTTQGTVNARVVVRDAQGEAIGWQAGSVLGLYLHGMLEDPCILSALFGVSVPSLGETFDKLADVVEASFRPSALDRLIEAS